MQYTLLQLFQLVDGRITTGICDIRKILGETFNETFLTDSACILLQQNLKEKPTEWYKQVALDILSLKKYCPIKQENKAQFNWLYEVMRTDTRLYTLDTFKY